MISRLISRKSAIPALRVLPALCLAVALVALAVPPSPLLAQGGDPGETPDQGEAGGDEGEPGDDGAGDDQAGSLEAPRVDDIDDILRGEEAIFGTFEGYSYNPGERRDPFRSLLVNREQDEEEGPRPDGIPGLLIDEITLIGILKTPEGYLAHVQAADRGQSYLLSEGQELYDGLVLSIEDNEVKFRQEVDDRTAVKPFRERVKVLNPS